MRRLQDPCPNPDDPDTRPVAAPGTLPAELTRFVGREDELAELGGLLEESRLVTVAGVAGVGKTRCVIRVAALREKRYCDGVLLAELSTVRDADLLEHALIDALGLADHTSRPPRAVLVEHLRERRTLLVIDGFEHLVDACADLVTDLLRRAPGLQVLAAGRCPLRVDGERTYPLAPMSDGDAVELFTERARGVRPGWEPATDERAAVLELCHRLDGIPLALELAAGRLRALSVEQVLLRLDDRFRLLTGGRRGAPPRHQTLRTAIGWSHELCTPEQRLLWARLSVFAGQFDLEAAEYICGGPDLPADAVLDVLDELIAQSVVEREDGPAGARYRLLDTVSEYGAQWLAATGDAERLRRRHRDWFLGLATWCELDWFSPRQAEVAARIDSELPNLRRAMECSMESPDEVHLAQHLAGTLWFYWTGCGRLSEGRHWLDHVLEEPTPHDAARLKVLWVLGYVAVLQGDAVGAISALQECREEAERCGDATALAYAVHRTGCLAIVTDDMERAEELLREALGRYREVGELNSNVLMAQVELAMAVAFLGDLDAAAVICDEVREICEDHGERWALAYALYVLAYAALRRGRPARARQMLGECLTIGRTFNDLLGTVLSLELLALVTAVEGDAGEAAVLQGAAEGIWPSVGLQLFGSAFYGRPRVECEEQARRELGNAAYEEGLRAGRRLDPATAVDRALAGGGPGAPVDGPGAGGVPAPGGPGGTRRPAASRMTGRGGPERW
ncbi:ATP-binding protein [Streptomyces parvus]|uniref:Tetratricopeptide repeat protein n=1 Tax=Streptomyces parvus TaxID=66428 RepID=A0A5D4JEH2_9ACTN|nr:AAA family ATPase [Streptomyces parvus]TYR63957.1 tetratricopeptide repeat protein [Streptomyces parvus]